MEQRDAPLDNRTIKKFPEVITINGKTVVTLGKRKGCNWGEMYGSTSGVAGKVLFLVLGSYKGILFIIIH